MQDNKKFILPKKAFGRKNLFALSQKSKYYSCFEKCSKQNSDPAVGNANDNEDKYKPAYDAEEKNVLYIQPIAAGNTYEKFGEILNNLRKWLEAFYSPCYVKVLPVVSEYHLQAKAVSFKLNGFAKTQYNADSILKNVIRPIKRELEDAVAVYTITDLDLYTNKARDFVLGTSMPAAGIIQSFHRFLPEFNFLTLEKEQDRYSKLLAKVLKIATHEVGHVFGHTHCKFFNCVMKGEYGVWETDESPIYLCPECYWKMFNFLKFDHTKRFEDLNELCEKFGGEFLLEKKDGKSYSSHFKKRLSDVRKIKSAKTVSRTSTNKNFIIKTVEENSQFISRSSSSGNFVTCSSFPKSEATIGLGLLSTMSHKRKMKRLNARKSVKDSIANCIFN